MQPAPSDNVEEWVQNTYHDKTHQVPDNSSARIIFSRKQEVDRVLRCGAMSPALFQSAHSYRRVRAERKDKSPAEILSGEHLWHWLELLEFERFKHTV